MRPEAAQARLHFAVLIGGAAINAHHGQRIWFGEPGVAYGAGVFFCKDAFWPSSPRGAAAGVLLERLQQAGDDRQSFFTHGLSVALAEALAE